MTGPVLAKMCGREIRELCRSGQFDRPTAGVAPGFVQVNLAVLRADAAKEFEAFCNANPKPCPLLEMTPPGDYEARQMAPGSDVRTDLPRYRVLRKGECIDRPTSIKEYWTNNHPPSPLAPDFSNSRPDGAAECSQGWSGAEPLVASFPQTPPRRGGGSVGNKNLAPNAHPVTKGDHGVVSASDCNFVAFLIGCSFTFETALLEVGIPVRHVEEGKNVPMYRTNRACTPAGRFHGPLVVSMRPMSPEQAGLATRITAAFPRVHGTPIHLGDPGAIGIADVKRPDYGDAVSIRPGEIPVFWACGVTPMEAILRAKLDIAIVHEPGHMLVTDIRDESLRIDLHGGPV